MLVADADGLKLHKEMTPKDARDWIELLGSLDFSKAVLFIFIVVVAFMVYMEKKGKRKPLTAIASGIGKAKLPAFQKRSEQVLSQLKLYEKKLMCLTNEEGTVRLRHVLTPALRHWVLDPVTIDEIRKTIADASQPPKPIGRPRKS